MVIQKRPNVTENEAAPVEPKRVKPKNEISKISKSLFKAKDDNVFKTGKLTKWLLQKASKFLFLSTFKMLTRRINPKNKEKCCLIPGLVEHVSI